MDRKFQSKKSRRREILQSPRLPQEDIWGWADQLVQRQSLGSIHKRLTYTERDEQFGFVPETIGQASMLFWLGMRFRLSTILFLVAVSMGWFGDRFWAKVPWPFF